VRRGSRVGLSHGRQYSARRSGSGLTYSIRAEDGSFLRWGDYNIPHQKKSVQSQGILRQLVPNLVGRVLGLVGHQEQNHEAWKPGWAEPLQIIFCKAGWVGPYIWYQSRGRLVLKVGGL
jgi:hypothetical protein